MWYGEGMTAHHLPASGLSPLQLTVAANLRAITASRKITQRELCEWLHCSVSAVSKKYNGVAPISVHEIEVLADRLGVSPTRFMDPVDHPDWRARRESNSQPSDPKSDLRLTPSPRSEPHLTLVRGGAA